VKDRDGGASMTIEIGASGCDGSEFELKSKESLMSWSNKECRNGD